jgi:hypothetical protein
MSSDVAIMQFNCIYLWYHDISWFGTIRWNDSSNIHFKMVLWRACMIVVYIQHALALAVLWLPLPNIWKHRSNMAPFFILEWYCGSSGYNQLVLRRTSSTITTTGTTGTFICCVDVSISNQVDDTMKILLVVLKINCFKNSSHHHHHHNHHYHRIRW